MGESNSDHSLWLFKIGDRFYQKKGDFDLGDVTSDLWSLFNFIIFFGHKGTRGEDGWLGAGHVW